MKRTSGSPSSPRREQRRVSIEEPSIDNNSNNKNEKGHSSSVPISFSHDVQSSLLYTSPPTPNGYHSQHHPQQYTVANDPLIQEQQQQHDDDEEDHDLVMIGSPTTLHSRKGRFAFLTGRSAKAKTSSSPRKVKKRKRCKIGKRCMNRWVKGVLPSFSSLFLAVLLWYGLGVLSIGTSKLLLMDQKEAGHHHHHHRRHHHPLIGGVPPLFLSLQQLLLGAGLLRVLLQIRFFGSVGLTPWPPQSVAIVEHRGRWSRSSPSSSSSACSDILSQIADVLCPSVHIQLVLAGILFSVGFLMTNYGFAGSSASFVETIKAAEPITSATVAVWSGIEVLSRQEMVGLAAIVVGVVLSTMGNQSSSADNGTEDEETATTSHWNSIQACITVLLANLCFSLRGLCQKLFRGTPEGSPQLVDDLNLQFRMQQTGILLLIGPVVVLDGWKIVRHVWHLSNEHGLWSSGVLSRYLFLALLNGFAFASYNLASTYILSRISVVHHAALNCVRRVFAIVITSLYFVVPVSLLGTIGIVVSLTGFLYFTHYKVKRQREPKPLSSLLPVSMRE